MQLQIAHSLVADPGTLFVGGALAILGALAIACDASMALRKDQVVCYAVAAPRVGNRNFAAAYELLVPNTWNVINDQVLQYSLHRLLS